MTLRTPGTAGLCILTVLSWTTRASGQATAAAGATVVTIRGERQELHDGNHEGFSESCAKGWSGRIRHADRQGALILRRLGNAPKEKFNPTWEAHDLA